MKKRILSLLLVLCFLITLSTSVSASADEKSVSNSSFATEEEMMKLTILLEHGIEVTPTNSYVLLDTAGNNTIVCVEFTHSNNLSGFGLIDLVGYCVTMYALDAVVPFTVDDTVVCGGVLDFAILNEDGYTATVLGSDEIVAAEVLYDTARVGVKVMAQNERATRVRSLKEKILKNASTRASETGTVLVDGGNDPNLVYSAGYNSGGWTTDCGINAVAMYLRHMDNYFNSTYVHSAHTTESSLKSTLAALAHGKWNITTKISMARLATLTNLYLDTYGATNATDVSKVNYTWNRYTTQINYGSGQPCILYIGEGATSYWSTAHAVLGVGYTAGATASSGYVVVNSGWTSLGYVNILTSIPGSMIK